MKEVDNENKGIEKEEEDKDIYKENDKKEGNEKSNDSKDNSKNKTIDQPVTALNRVNKDKNKLKKEKKLIESENCEEKK